MINDLRLNIESKRNEYDVILAKIDLIRCKEHGIILAMLIRDSSIQAMRIEW